MNVEMYRDLVILSRDGSSGVFVIEPESECLVLVATSIEAAREEIDDLWQRSLDISLRLWEIRYAEVRPEVLLCPN